MRSPVYSFVLKIDGVDSDYLALNDNDPERAKTLFMTKLGWSGILTPEQQEQVEVELDDFYYEG